MRVHCRTNIDDCQRLEWPTNLPALPNVGDLIRSPSKMEHGIEIELQVCRITWVKTYNFSSNIGEFQPEIELTMPTHRFHNFSHFRAILEYALGRIDQTTLQSRTKQAMDANN